MQLLSPDVGKQHYNTRRHFFFTLDISSIACFFCFISVLSESSSASDSRFSWLRFSRRAHPEELQEIQKLSASDDSKVLNVHVVPHTHDDVGWLKTVEEYYYGLNMTIQTACVRDILDSVVSALLANPSRTFTYVEQKFFSMWWNQQSDAVKESVRFLVDNGQLSFVNGGWCMHDEATTHFMGMIDQTALGHEFLKRELGVTPKVGWQLDPFGHSATQASLLTAQVGFDALYFGRIDYQDRARRWVTQENEGLWSVNKPSNSNDTSAAAVFWGLTGSYSGNYGPPTGFCFDTLCGERAKNLEDMDQTQLLDVVDEFFTQLRLQADRTKGNHIMLTMGEDFNYRRANQNFANMDILLNSVMKFQLWDLVDISAVFGPRFDRINIFYSSPEYYTKMKFQQTSNLEHKIDPEKQNGFMKTISNKKNNKVAWSVKAINDDFFPYSDCEVCFWTGYFTSRAAFKRFERVASSFLLAARQIQAMTTVLSSTSQPKDSDRSNGSTRPHRPLYALEDALGIVQHHDAVSGTAKQHVANDYSKRLQKGMDQASNFMIEIFKKLIQLKTSSTGEPRHLAIDNLSYCQLLNETICDVSQKATMKKNDNMTDIIYAVVYNALATNRLGAVVRIPVSQRAKFLISGVNDKNNTTKSQTIKSIECPLSVSTPKAAKYVVIFDTGNLPPLGYAIFQIQMLNEKESDNSDSNSIQISEGAVRMERVLVEKDTNTNIGQSGKEVIHNSVAEDDYVAKVSNNFFSAQFSSSTGMLKDITVNDVTVNISQSWGYYTSYDSHLDKESALCNPTQNSGAYIFRPGGPNPNHLHTIRPKDRAKFVSTGAGVEIHTQFEQSWIKQVTRILNGLPYVEIEYMIGPVPIDDGRGKEIVTRFETPIQSDATFYTDSNGRAFLERKRNYRPSWSLNVYEPVAGNYYPVNAAMYVEDDHASLAVLVDRSQGGASILDGSIELMVQRRTLRDDSRGVGESLNETVGGITPNAPYGNATRIGNGVIIRGMHRILVGKGKSGASLARSAMDETFSDPIVFVGSSPTSTTKSDNVDVTQLQLNTDSTKFSAILQKSLPPNVMLITLKKVDDDSRSFLVRFGHQYDVNEDDVMSQPVKIDFTKILSSSYTVVSIVEKTLAGVEDYNDWVDRRMDWTGAGQLSRSTIDSNSNDSNTTSFVLKPLEIRTFIISLRKNSKMQKHAKRIKDNL